MDTNTDIEGCPIYERSCDMNHDIST
jgi:hypothetical protein